MRFVSLFAGIGGIDLGLERAGWRCVAQVELDPYCRAVLAKHWPDVPRFGDISGVSVRDLPATDALVGGFPCQPVSVAGSRKGHADERWLWPEFFRLVREVRPRWLVAENVPGLRTLGADGVIEDLESCGYAVWPLVVGADDVGAPHRRKRVFVVGRLVPNAGIERRQQIARGASCDEGTDEGWQTEHDHVAPAVIEDVAHGGSIQRLALGEPERSSDGNAEAIHQSDIVAHRDGGGCGRSGEPEPSGIEGARWGQSDGRGEGRTSAETMAYGESGGFGVQRGESDEGRRGHADERGEDLADADIAGRGEQRGPVAVRTEQLSAERSGHAWPSRPGEPQYEWEPSRLVAASSRNKGSRRASALGVTVAKPGQGAVGGRAGTTTGGRPEPRLGQLPDGLSRGLAPRDRRARLKALGNAVVPQCAEAIGRAILKVDAQICAGIAVLARQEEK